MNKSYRLIWNSMKEAWVVVAETVKNKGSLPSFVVGSAALMAAVLCGAMPVSALDPGALPTGGRIVAGSGSISQAGTSMTVTQGSQRMVADWTTFNIGQNASVVFQQPNAAAIALNRIQDQNPSKIFGSLSANGQVWLLNPSGIIFGGNARVDVGGLVASSLNITNENFLAGNHIFERLGTAGAITNLGAIHAANGGYIAMVSPKISNEGLMTAQNGTVALAAGDKVSLDFTGDKLVTFTVEQGAIDTLAENKGLIKADGGLVMMTAKAASALTTAVVNNSGVIEAQTLENRSGRILLIADMQHGETIVGGKLDASAPNGGDGGFIETSAAKVMVKNGVQVNTLATNGKTGDWLIDPNDYKIDSVANGGDITGAQLATNLGTTNVTIDTTTQGTGGGNGDIFVNEAVSKTGSTNTTLTLRAQRNIAIDNAISSSTYKLNVVLTPDSDNNGSGNVSFGASGSVKTNNGNFYIGSLSGINLSQLGQDVTFASGSYVNTDQGVLSIAVKGDITLHGNSLKFNNGGYYDNSGNYQYQSSFLQLLTNGSILTANTVATTPDMVTFGNVYLTANTIGQSGAGQQIKIAGATNADFSSITDESISNRFPNYGRTLFLSNTGTGGTYVNEINKQIFSTIQLSIGNTTSGTQNIQIMDDARGDGTTGTGHIIATANGAGVLSVAARGIDTSGIKGTSTIAGAQNASYFEYDADPTKNSIFPTSVTLSAPTIQVTNDGTYPSINTGTGASYRTVYGGTTPYSYSNCWGYCSSGTFWPTVTLNGSTSITSDNTTGGFSAVKPEITTYSLNMTSPNMGVNGNSLLIGTGSTLTVYNTGGSTYINSVDNTYQSLNLTNVKTSGSTETHDIRFFDSTAGRVGDHLNYNTNSTGIYVPTIDGNSTTVYDATTFSGMDVSRASRTLNMTAASGAIEYDNNAVNTGAGAFTATISSSNSAPNAGKWIYGTNTHAANWNPEITAGDISLTIGSTTAGSISDIDFAQGYATTSTGTPPTYSIGTATANKSLSLNVYSHNISLREVTGGSGGHDATTSSHIKTITTSLNGNNAAQTVAIDLAGPDDVAYSDSGSLITVNATKVNVSGNNRNWYLNAGSRNTQIGTMTGDSTQGNSLSTGYYYTYANNLRLDGDVMTNGSNIILSGNSGIELARTTRVDSNADNTTNSTSTGTSGTVEMSGVIYAKTGTSSNLTVDTSSSDSSGNTINLWSGTDYRYNGTYTGEYLRGITLNARGSSATYANDGTIYLKGNTYNLNGNFSSTGWSQVSGQRSLTVDTWQTKIGDGSSAANTGNAGNITFGGRDLYVDTTYGYGTVRLDASAGSGGGNAGNIDLYTYTHSTLNVNALDIITTSTAGTAGSVNLPAISSLYNSSNWFPGTADNHQTINAGTSGIVTLNGDLRSQLGAISLTGDIRLATNTTIDTWNSTTVNGNSQQTATAGSVTIAGTGVSTTAANRTLTINTSTDTSTGYFNPPTNTQSWTHNGGAVNIKAGTAGGSAIDTLVINTTKNGTYNNGSNGTITLNGVSTTGNQTYTGGAATIAGNLATNGGNINLSGVASLALSNGPISITTDMAGGTSAAGTLNLGSHNLNSAQALSIDTTADGGGAATALTLNTIGNTTPLTSLSVKAASLTLNSTIAAAGNITLQSTSNSADITLNNAITSTGGNVVLASGRNFINNVGANVLTAGAGKYWQVWSATPANDTRNGMTYTFKQYNATYGVTSVAGSGNGFLYTTAPTITPSLTGTASKQYNGSTTATLAAGNYSTAGAIDGDTVVVAASGATYDTKNVGTGKTVTATGIGITSATNGAATVYGYQMASTTANAAIGEITAKPMTVSGITAADKVHDGTTTATVSTGNATLNGLVGGDTVTVAATGTFATADAGTAKTVNLVSTYGGADKNNYAITDQATTTADITPRPVVPSGSNTPVEVTTTYLTSPQQGVNSTQSGNSPVVQVTHHVGAGSGSPTVSTVGTTSLVFTQLSPALTLPSGKTTTVSLSSNTTSTPVSFATSSGGGLILTTGSSSTPGQMSEVGTLPMFMQTGNAKPAMQGGYKIMEGSNALAINQSSTGQTSQPPSTTDTSGGVPFTLTQSDGIQIRLTASVSSEGFLVLNVPEHASKVDPNQAMLLGMQVAKQELKADVKALKGVLIIN